MNENSEQKIFYLHQKFDMRIYIVMKPVVGLTSSMLSTATLKDKKS